MAEQTGWLGREEDKTLITEPIIIHVYNCEGIGS